MDSQASPNYRSHWRICVGCKLKWEPEWVELEGDTVEACRHCGHVESQISSGEE